MVIKACTNLVGVKPKVAGVTAAALEESKGTELEEPKIVTVTTPALRWESEKGVESGLQCHWRRRLEP